MALEKRKSTKIIIHRNQGERTDMKVMSKDTRKIQTTKKCFVQTNAQTS